MLQIIQTVDLTKVWGKDKDMDAVSDVFNGQLFNVLLDKGEMMPQKYSCDLPMLALLESFHGQHNVVVISKSVKGKEKTGGGFFYNDVITDIMPLSKYARINVTEAYESKFAKKFVRRASEDYVPPKAGANETASEEERG
jgi:hypothetical protein